MDQAILDYAPHSICDEQTWAAIADVVRAAVQTQHLTKRDSAWQWMTYTTRYFTWCHRQGHPMVITEPLVAAFCDALSLTPSSVQTHRTRLRRMGIALGTIEAPARTIYTQKTASGQAPYTSVELDRWWQVASSQKTAHRSRLFQAVIALGAGAGVSTSELGNLRTSDIQSHPTYPDLLLVHVAGRVAAVDVAWRERVLELRETCDGEYVLGSPHAQNKDLLTYVKSKAAIPDDVPALTVRRLRTTYAVTLLNRRLSVSEVMAILGSTSAITFERLARFVEPRWDDAEYLRIAAGIA